MKRRQFFLTAVAGIAVTSSCTKPQAPPSSAAPTPETSSEREISYLVELEDQGKATPVSEDLEFKSGQRFRILLEAGFPAYIYVANRGTGESSYKMLFPLADERARNPLAKGKQVVLPSESEWMRFDETAGNEYFVLIASTISLPDLERAGAEISRDTFEADLAKVERAYRPDSSRRFRDGNKIKFFAAREGELALVVRFALAHG